MTVSNTHSHYTEAGLISKLESLGIGRPSTFASLVETIIDRGYVAKTNIEGKPIPCDEYLLKNSNITKESITKIFGTEKNKLIIQPIGELCIDFLTEHFTALFEYDYTKKMEDTLDEISIKTSATDAETDGSILCKTVDLQIKSYIDLVDKVEKQAYTLLCAESTTTDPSKLYEFIFTKYGGSIRSRCDSSPYEYHPVNKDVTIDLDKLKRGEYYLSELLESQNTLGEFKDFPISLKKGQYGYYLEWNGTNHSLKNYDGDINAISLEIAIRIIDEPLSTDVSTSSTFIIRNLSKICSIRRGKYGPYIYYMNSNMKKPEFYNIKKFKEDYTTCDASKLIDWVNKTQKVSLIL